MSIKSLRSESYCVTKVCKSDDPLRISEALLISFENCSMSMFLSLRRSLTTLDATGRGKSTRKVIAA